MWLSDEPWQPYEKILIQLAKRDSWHGEEWYGVMTTNSKQIHRCLICQAVVSEYPIMEMFDSFIRQELKDHGLDHLRERNLLTFV